MTLKKQLMLRKLIFFISFLLLLILIYFSSNTRNTNLKKLDHNLIYPLLVWWKPMIGLDKEYTETRYCGINKCTFTCKRDIKQASALLFYGSELDVVDFPIPRLSHHVWALLHEESPRNVPFVPHTSFLQNFNFTSTLSSFSDYPLTTIYLHDVKDLTSPEYLVPVGEKTLLQKKENLAPIVFLQSDCDTSSERDAYVEELMKFIRVDSYGSCLHNRDLPESLSVDYLSKLNSPELYHFLSRYKFILSYENGVCNDYITEKFWRPLVIGSIPIYFGSPTIKDWQPNIKSVIHITDFSSPKALADYVAIINLNDSEYNSFLKHKYNQLQPIDNIRLQQELLFRDYAFSVSPNVMGLFECFVCSQLHKNLGKPKTATIKHYDCPFPPMYPLMSGRRSSAYLTWKSIMSVGKCQADIISELLQRNTPYSEEQFNNILNLRIQTGDCD